MKYKFKHLVIGGTFDRLHKGHKSLLRESFALGKKVTIGITSDKYAADRSKEKTQNFEDRLRELEGFLDLENYTGRTAVLKLNNLFGSTLDDRSIDSIIVTRDSQDGARRINEERKKRGLKPLKIIRFPLILGEKKRVISSTNIKMGLTNRQGDDYFSAVYSNKHFLPDGLRVQISKPQGRIILENELSKFNYAKYSKVITVGDIVTKTFVKHKLRFDLAVVDLNSNRKKLFKRLDELGLSKPSRLTIVKNQRGTISKSLTKAIRDMIVNNFNGAVIKVVGEEDLAVIPAVILAPLSSLIFYGQRNEGIVCVEVTEKTKERFLKIIESFKKV